MSLPIDLENERPVVEELEAKTKPALDLYRDIMPSLMETGKDIIGDDPKKLAAYSKNLFIVNRAMSQHIDCLAVAQAMTAGRSIPPKCNYLIYLNMIRKHTRERVAWKDKSDLDKIVNHEEKAKVIAEYHGYSIRIAREIVGLYDDVQIQKMKEVMEKGG